MEEECRLSRRVTIDWNAIKLEYITTNASYRQLAEKYGADHVKIAARGKDEGWVEERRKWKKGVIQKALDIATDAEAERLDTLRQSADALVGIVQEVSGDKDNFVYGGQFSARSMQATVSALKDLTTVIRNLYELPTQGEKEAQALARERLAMEKERLALEKARAGDGGDGAVCGVVEIGGVLEEDEE